MRQDQPDTTEERWLRTEGVARYDAYHRNANGRPAAEVFERLRERAAGNGRIETRSSTKR